MVFSTRCAEIRTPPQALRAATDLSTTVLFLPLLNGLCRVYTCMPGSPWLTTSWSCFEGPHLAVTVAVSVLLALFSAACALGAYVDAILHPLYEGYAYYELITARELGCVGTAALAVLIDRNPLSEAFASSPHGRVNAGLCCMKVLLALAFSLRQPLGQTVLLVVVSTTAVAQLWALLYYLPFYHVACNALHCALAALHAWAAVCAIVAAVRH